MFFFIENHNVEGTEFFEIQGLAELTHSFIYFLGCSIDCDDCNNAQLR